MLGIAELGEVEIAEIEEAVGPQAFQRGRGYARQGRVIAFGWDPDGEVLAGSVVGHGAVYRTVASFDVEGGEFEEGECSCPVGYNCKHVAALVIAAMEKAPEAKARPSRARHLVAVDPERPSWEEPLRALLNTPAGPTAGLPLALELNLHAPGSREQGALRLMARLMRPGARGGWVNGSLSWSRLDSWQLRGGEYRGDHLALVRELHAIHRAREGRSGYYYSYGAEKTLDLTGCDSPQLWSLLDEAARLGMALVHGHGASGEVQRHEGQVVIDVTRDGEHGWLASPQLRVHGVEPTALQPLAFLGASGHGIVCAERTDIAALRGPDDWRLRLVRLPRPTAPSLQRWLLEEERLEIPAAELQRFAEELSPALRHVAPVISSDDSFAPPEVSGPTLTLRVGYGADHTVEAAWTWAYQVGETMSSQPLAASTAGPGIRDHDAERALLANIELSGTGLARFGLLDDLGRPGAAESVWLTGLDSLRFTTEELPRLEQMPELAVEVAGEPPDYRDVGDSLSIGVSTTEIAGERDWFDLGVTISVEGRELSFAEVFTALASGESHMLLPDGAHFSLDSDRLQSLRALIEEARALTESAGNGLRISRYQAGLWSELAALGVVTEQAQAWQRQVEALAELDGLADHEPPPTVSASLRHYQREGFSWLASLWELELGGILADDMGLGKTLQTLALICHARARDPELDPFLVVAPTSVVSSWVSEAAHFAPGLRVEALTDTLARSGRRLEDVAAAADVVVTTYTLFRLEAEAYRRLPWAGLVLDEAQFVKNHQAKTYRCVRELDAPFKLAITGTPMENNLMELWSLLSIAAPGLFPDPNRFTEQYARPIERRGDAERLARLRRRIKPLVKRRTKELVAGELPAKQEQTLLVDLHPRHRKIYDTHLQRERQKVLGLIGDLDRNRFTILRSITRLRQMSLHPGLVDRHQDGVPCAKIASFAEQLEDVVGSGHRALVFSQFTTFLAMVRQRLDQEGIGYCYLDGRTRRRDRVIERFKRGEDPLFLISLKAGGFGLNLTEADYCFLLDPWWNPATETQAIDRTHRIGQTRPVNVYRMIARDTIEEKVLALARRKAALFKGVMDEGDLFASRLTVEEIRGLFD